MSKKQVDAKYEPSYDQIVSAKIDPLEWLSEKMEYNNMKAQRSIEDIESGSLHFVIFYYDGALTLYTAACFLEIPKYGVVFYVGYCMIDDGADGKPDFGDCSGQIGAQGFFSISAGYIVSVYPLDFIDTYNDDNYNGIQNKFIETTSVFFGLQGLRIFYSVGFEDWMTDMYSRSSILLFLRNEWYDKLDMSLKPLPKYNVVSVSDAEAFEDDPYGLKRWESWQFKPLFYLGYFGDVGFHLPMHTQVLDITRNFPNLLVLGFDYVYDKFHQSGWHNASKTIFVFSQYDLAAFNQQTQFSDIQITDGDMAAVLKAYVMEYYGTRKNYEWRTDPKFNDQAGAWEYAGWRCVAPSNVHQISTIVDMIIQYRNSMRAVKTQLQGIAAITIALAAMYGGVHIPFTTITITGAATHFTSGVDPLTAAFNFYDKAQELVFRDRYGV